MATYSRSADDFSNNPYFKLLVSKFKKKFDYAQDTCCLICIPQSSAIQNVNFTSEFVDDHTLLKSPIFKNQYLTTDKHFSKTVEVENNVIKTLNGFKENRNVNIIGQEYGYNKKSKQFKIVILEKPLTPVQRLVTKPSKNDIFQKQIKNTVDGITFAKCDKFLHQNPAHEKVIGHLDDLLMQFNKNYLILPSFLHCAASKLVEVIDDSIEDFSVIYKSLIDENFQIKGDIYSIIESYVMGSVHSKVFPVICQQLNKEDKILSDKLLRLNKVDVTPDRLGVREIFSVPQTAAVVELASLDSYHTPLEKVNCLTNTIKLMTEAVDQSIKENRSILKLTMVQIPTLIADDIIAILTTIIIQAKLTHLASNMFYIEYFHRSNSDYDKSSYDLVTFEAAVNYIKSNDFSNLKPAENQLKKELSLEELMEITERLQIQQNEEHRQSEQTCPGKVNTPLKSSTCMMSGVDRKLANITRMIEKSTQELQSVETLGVSKSNQHKGNGSLGEFLTNLQDSYGVSYGKQS